MPAVAVVIPAFNRPRRLFRAVESVLDQTIRDFELVVVDDASSEDLSIVRDRVEGSGHRWLRFEENRGPQVARNAGAAATDSEWIAFLDSDDLWLPEKLERQLAWHADYPGIQISQCEEAWIRNGVRVKKPDHLRQPETGNIYENCVERCCVSATCAMLSRAMWDRFGGFDERYWTCEDYELWLRISLEHEVGLVPGEWAEKHGGHPDQISGSFRAIDRWRVLALMERMAAGLPEGKRKLAMEGIRKKAGILRAGAEKRATPEAELFRAIESWVQPARASGTVAVPVELIDSLRTSCFSQGNPQLPAPGHPGTPDQKLI